MTKEEIIKSLEDRHVSLFEWLDRHPPDKWTKGPAGKWTTGQQIKHLVQSLRALNKGMSIPKFILKWRIGVSNRPVRTYDHVVQRYLDRLEANPGVVAPAARGMKVPDLTERNKLISQLKKEKVRLIKRIKHWKDKDLNHYILPHPLMGKMPVKEIVMWTAYHTEHHFNQLKEKY